MLEKLGQELKNSAHPALHNQGSFCTDLLLTTSQCEPTELNQREETAQNQKGKSPSEGRPVTWMKVKWEADKKALHTIFGQMFRLGHEVERK